MNPVPTQIDYDYDQMKQDFESEKKQAPAEPIKVADGLYKKPVGRSRQDMFVRDDSAPAPAPKKAATKAPAPAAHTLQPVYEAPAAPKKKKRQCSEKQRAHLARCRVKALETRRRNAALRREGKEVPKKTRKKAAPAPAPAPSPAPAPVPSPAPAPASSHQSAEAVFERMFNAREEKRLAAKKVRQAEKAKAKAARRKQKQEQFEKLVKSGVVSVRNNKTKPKPKPKPKPAPAAPKPKTRQLEQVNGRLVTVYK